MLNSPFEQDYGGYLLKLNGDFNWDSTVGVTSLTYIDDNIGYGIFTGILMNGGQNAFEIYSNELNGDSWEEQQGYYPWDTHVDDTHSDIFFLNDSIGYAVSGNVLMRTIQGQFSGIKENINNKQEVFVITKDGNLIVKSNILPIRKIEVINISGNVIFKQNLDNKQMEESINVTSFFNALYLVKVTLSDNTTSVTKWVKH